MVRTGLQVENGHDFIAVHIEGIPLGRYTSQIFQLLADYNLAFITQSLARPIFSRHEMKTQWFYDAPITQITPWREASTEEQIECLQQLIDMVAAIEHLRQRLTQQAHHALSIIDPLLKNLTVIPSTEAIFLVNQRPVVVYWGHYNDQRCAIDLHSLHKGLQTNIAASIPITIEPLVAIRPKSNKRRYYLVVICGGLLLTLLAIIVQSTTTPSVHSSIMAVTPSPPDELLLSLARLQSITARLPVKTAILTAPVPKKDSAIVPKHQDPLMIPTHARYQGSTAFLDGHWQADLIEADKRTTLSFIFKQGQAKTTAKVDNKRCSATSEAGFTATGKLMIVSKRMRCQDQTTFTPPPIVCEKSAPNTECVWKTAASTLVPVTLYNKGT